MVRTMDVSARGLLTVSLALLAGCPQGGGAATQASATVTDTSGSTATSEGSATDASATLPTTTAPTSDPTATTAGSTGVVSETGTATEGVDTASTGATTGDPTATTGGASSGTDGSTGGSTGGGSTGGDTTMGGDTTGGDTTGGDTTGTGGTTGGTTGGDTTGDTTGGGGDQEPFFPPCGVLAIGEPITLEDVAEPGNRKWAAPLAYDGHDLVVVREDWNPMVSKCEFVFERRDPMTSALLDPGVRSVMTSSLCGWNAAAGYDPVSDTFMFVNLRTSNNIGLTAIDAKGSQLWNASEWPTCNSLVQTVDVASRGGEWVVMGEVLTCGGEERAAAAAVYTTAGVHKFGLKTPKATAETNDAACDLPACDRLLTLRFGNEGQDSGTWTQMGDLVTGKLDAKKTKLNGSAYGGWDANGAVWNGTDWLILRVEDTGPSHKWHVGRWDENLGWTTPISTFAGGETPTEIELLWTGHDYVGAYAAFPDTNSQLPNSFYDLDIYIFLIGADGKPKKNQIFERPKGFGGYSPQLVALPGAIGLSWVRVTKNPNNSLTYTRHLSQITCAD